MTRKSPDTAYITHKSGWVHGVWFKILIILLIGLVAGYFGQRAVSQLYRENLQSRAAMVADVLSGDTVEALKDPSNSAYHESYDDVKRKFAAVKESIGNGRFVYLMARNDAKGVYFLVDSEESGTDGYSPNGQVYTEASDELKQIFVDGGLFVEGPVRDRWGSWLSAHAPVKGENGNVIAVLGMDVPASTYVTMLAVSGGLPILIACLASVVVYMGARARRLDEEALRMRSELVSIASHELRSPLSGLRWSQELMLSYPLDEKVKKSVDLMHNSTIKLQESIEDVLQLANLQAGGKRLDLADVNVSLLIDDVFAVQQPAAAEHQLTLSRAQDWPDTLLVRLDERRMKRVLNNLVSNAIKYGRPNTEVTIGYRKSQSGHVISVSDHGIGIPAEDQQKVFSGFFRADNARKAAVEGTGMGLYLSRAIVEQHGGKLWFESSEQAGTTIYLQLPFSKNDAKEA